MVQKKKEGETIGMNKVKEAIGIVSIISLVSAWLTWFVLSL